MYSATISPEPKIIADDAAFDDKGEKPILEYNKTDHTQSPIGETLTTAPINGPPIIVALCGGLTVPVFFISFLISGRTRIKPISIIAT